MDLIVTGTKQAFWLLLSGDPEVWRITFLSFQISLSATFISLLLGIPLGAFLALKEFPGRRFVISLVNTGMSLPPVVVGLFVTIFLWRNGPLGFFRLLYTPTAMVIAQVIIAAPIVTGLTLAAIQQLNPKLRCKFSHSARHGHKWYGFCYARLVYPC